MEPTVKKESAEKIPFLERSIVRTILPIAGFVIICVLFAILTDGKLFKPKNISLLLSQSYMLLISSIGVFMVMTMGGLDFSQGSMLGVCSIVVCYLSHYNIILAVIGGVVTGGLIGLMNGYFNVKRKITSFIVTICSMYLFRGVCAGSLAEAIDVGDGGDGLVFIGEVGMVHLLRVADDDAARVEVVVEAE